MSDRLTARDKAIKDAYKYAKKQKGNDRVTSEDLKDAEEMIKSFQNDRTKGLPQEAYEQEDQTISYEAPKMNMGGECRGSKAIKGKKFSGVF